MNLQENILRIKEMMGLLNEQTPEGLKQDLNISGDTQKQVDTKDTEIEKEDDEEVDFSESEVKDVVYRVGEVPENFAKGGGIWFGETYDGPMKFAISVKGKHMKSHPYLINLRNPYYYESFWHGYIKDVQPQYDSALRGMERENWMKHLMSLGYDGIIIDTDTWNDTGDENSVTSKQYVVFDPKNVKKL